MGRIRSNRVVATLAGVATLGTVLGVAVAFASGGRAAPQIGAPAEAPASAASRLSEREASRSSDGDATRVAAREAAGQRLGERVRAKAVAGMPLATQRAFIAERLQSRGVAASTADALLAYAVDGISMRPAQGRRASHLGGRAPLRSEETWPLNERSKLPLSVLAVLDLAELRAMAPLPPDGTLVLFYDHGGMENDMTEAWMDLVASVRVRWYPAGTALVERAAPKRAPSYPRVSLDGVTMPIIGGLPWDFSRFPGGARSVKLVDEMIFAMLNGAYSPDQLLGASQDIQEPVLGDIAYSFREMSSAQSRARYTAQERRGKGWTLLAQIGGAGSDDMMFADGGNVSFIVPTADLAERRFDRAVAILQSS